MPSRKFRVGGVPEHFNLPWHLAAESGAFADAGIDLEYCDFPGGTGALTGALAEGELDIALVLSEGGVANILRGGENRLCKIYVNSPLIWGIYVAANDRSETMEQARGGRYAVSRTGSGSHLMAIVDASERGWDTNAFEFIKVGGLAGAISALPAGEAELFLWEQTMTQPHVEDGTFKRIDRRATRWPSFMASATRSVLDSSADSVRTILELAAQFAADLKQREDNVELISERYALDREETRGWLDHVQWSDSFDRPDKALVEVISYLEKLDMVPTEGAVPDDVWFNV